MSVPIPQLQTVSRPGRQTIGQVRIHAEPLHLEMGREGPDDPVRQTTQRIGIRLFRLGCGFVFPHESLEITMYTS